MTTGSEGIWTGAVRAKAIEDYGPNGVQVQRWLISLDDQPEMVGVLGYVEQFLRNPDNARLVLRQPREHPGLAATAKRFAAISPTEHARIRSICGHGSETARRASGRKLESWLRTVALDSKIIDPVQNEMSCYGIEAVGDLLLLRPWLADSEFDELVDLYASAPGVRELLASFGPVDRSSLTLAKSGCMGLLAAGMVVVSTAMLLA